MASKREQPFSQESARGWRMTMASQSFPGWHWEGYLVTQKFLSQSVSLWSRSIWKSCSQIWCVLCRRFIAIKWLWHLIKYYCLLLAYTLLKCFSVHAVYWIIVTFASLYTFSALMLSVWWQERHLQIIQLLHFLGTSLKRDNSRIAQQRV